MIRLSPAFGLYLFVMSVTVLVFMHLLDQTGITEVHPLFYKIYLTVWCLIFFWWPVDLLINWEKRTEASLRKDRVLACAAFSVILFVYPYHWLGTPPLPTLFFAIGAGCFLPGLFAMLREVKNKRVVMDPGSVFRLGMASPRAQEFLKYFPHANQYVYGFTEGDGDRAHLLLHQRKVFEPVKGASLDYCMDIVVDRRLGKHMGGQEKLQCYLFVNNGSHAGVGFLPCANIGRAMDYGFSDDELEHALEDIESSKDNWAALNALPLPIQSYPGQYVRIR